MTTTAQKASPGSSQNQKTDVKDKLGNELPAAAFENEAEPRANLDFLSDDEKAGYRDMVASLKKKAD